MSHASRQQILADIRRELPVDAPLPPADGPWTRYADPRQQFFDMLVAVGGTGRAVASAQELRREVEHIAASVGARRIFSAVPAAAPGNVGWETIDDPHDLADVDLAVMPGELAVAENAAVWVTEAPVPQRSAYFLTQHLALVVPADRLVHNMHEAYQWLMPHPMVEAARFKRAAELDRLRCADETGRFDHGASEATCFAAPMFGAFLSGPSKTADIEQALVIGAHGPRSLHVVLYALEGN